MFLNNSTSYALKTDKEDKPSLGQNATTVISVLCQVAQLP